MDGSDVETQWSTCTNGAQTSPVAGAEPREVMPLVSYRASAEAVLRWERSDRVVSGLRWEQRDRVLAGVVGDSPPNKFSVFKRRSIWKRHWIRASFSLRTSRSGSSTGSVISGRLYMAGDTSQAVRFGVNDRPDCMMILST